MELSINNTDFTRPLSNSSVSLEHGDDGAILESGTLSHSYSRSSSSEKVYQSLLHDFYAFDHPRNRWILAALSSQEGIRRLQRHWRSQLRLLHSYYEVPDSPQCHPLLRRGVPAFHALTSLYMTPLAIAVYSRNEAALRFLLANQINCVRDPVFVQRWWSKGEDTYLTDFGAISLVALVLRQGHFSLLPLLMVPGGYDPSERVCHVDHIQSAEECRTRFFHDSLDLALQLMHESPGLNIGQFLRVVCSRGVPHRFDPVVYDLDRELHCSRKGSSSQYRLRSLFRLLMLPLVQPDYTGVGKILTVLDTIRQAGLFRTHKDPVSVGDEAEHSSVCEGRWTGIGSNEIETQRVRSGAKLCARIGMELAGRLVRLDRELCLLLLLQLATEEGRRQGHHTDRIYRLLVLALTDFGQLGQLIQPPEAPSQHSSTQLPSWLDRRCCGLPLPSPDDIRSVKKTLLQTIENSPFLHLRLSRLKCPGRSTNQISASSQSGFQPTKTNSDPGQVVGPKTQTYLKCTSHAMRTWNMPAALPLHHHYNHHGSGGPSNVELLNPTVKAKLSHGGEASLASLRHRISLMRLHGSCKKKVRCPAACVEAKNGGGGANLLCADLFPVRMCPPPLVVRHKAASTMMHGDAAGDTTPSVDSGATLIGQINVPLTGSG